MVRHSFVLGVIFWQILFVSGTQISQDTKVTRHVDSHREIVVDAPAKKPEEFHAKKASAPTYEGEITVPRNGAAGLAHDLNQTSSDGIVGRLIGGVIWSVFIFLFACKYKSLKQNYPETMVGTLGEEASWKAKVELLKGEQASTLLTGGVWSSEFCEQPMPLGICLTSFCCPCIRWADNMTLIGTFSNFWLALAVVCGLWVIDFAAGNILVWFLVAAAFAYFRRGIRRSFQFKDDGAWSFAKDCCCYLCWPCNICMLVQEANHIEQAAKYNCDVIKQEKKESV